MRGSTGGVRVEASARLASKADATATTDEVARMIQYMELGSLIEDVDIEQW
jgi:hypothetical protein